MAKTHKSVRAMIKHADNNYPYGHGEEGSVRGLGRVVRVLLLLLLLPDPAVLEYEGGGQKVQQERMKRDMCFLCSSCSTLGWTLRGRGRDVAPAATVLHASHCTACTAPEQQLHHCSRLALHGTVRRGRQTAATSSFFAPHTARLWCMNGGTHARSQV